MLASDHLGPAVTRLRERVAPLRQALDAADRELGDGDTGMTVEQLVSAWNAAVPELTGDIGASLSALGRATRRASGSSLGSVVAIGLAAAGKSVQGQDALDATGIGSALDAATAAITARSGASPGDKTILDSLLRIASAVRAREAKDDLLETCIAASAQALAEFRDRECKLGRARMYGARSAGRDDPGMLAACLVLRALKD